MADDSRAAVELLPVGARAAVPRSSASSMSQPASRVSPNLQPIVAASPLQTNMSVRVSPLLRAHSGVGGGGDCDGGVDVDAEVVDLLASASPGAMSPMMPLASPQSGVLVAASPLSPGSAVASASMNPPAAEEEDETDWRSERAEAEVATEYDDLAAATSPPSLAQLTPQQALLGVQPGTITPAELKRPEQHSQSLAHVSPALAPSSTQPRSSPISLSTLSLAQITAAATLAASPTSPRNVNPASHVPSSSPPAAAAPSSNSVAVSVCTPNAALLNCGGVAAPQRMAHAALGAVRLPEAQRALLSTGGGIGAMLSPAANMAMDAGNAALTPGQQSISTTIAPSAFGSTGAPLLPPRPLWLQQKLNASSGEPVSRLLGPGPAALAAAAAAAAASAGVPAYPAYPSATFSSSQHAAPSVAAASSSAASAQGGSAHLIQAMDDGYFQLQAVGSPLSASSPTGDGFMLTSPSSSSSSSASASAMATSASSSKCAGVAAIAPCPSSPQSRSLSQAATEAMLVDSGGGVASSSCVSSAVRKTSRAMSCSSPSSELSVCCGTGAELDAVDQREQLPLHQLQQQSEEDPAASPLAFVRADGLLQALSAAFVQESMQMPDKLKAQGDPALEMGLELASPVRSPLGAEDFEFV